MKTPEEYAAELVSIVEPMEGRYCAGIADFILSGNRWPDRERAENDAEAARRCLSATIRQAMADAARAALACPLTSPVSEERLAEVRVRLASVESWPGPWHLTAFSANCGPAGPSGHTRPGVGCHPDAVRFVEGAREDIPALLRHIDHLEGVLRDALQDDASAAYLAGYRAAIGAAATHIDGLTDGEAERHLLRAAIESLIPDDCPTG